MARILLWRGSSAKWFKYEHRITERKVLFWVHHMCRVKRGGGESFRQNRPGSIEGEIMSMLLNYIRRPWDY